MIVYVTTWGQACGIATYTRDLITGLPSDLSEVLVLAPEEACVFYTSVAPAVQCWQRNNRSLDQLLLIHLERHVPVPPAQVVVHFQHEFGLFPYDDVFLSTLRACRGAGYKVAVTLHTVTAYGDWRRSLFWRQLSGAADVVFVHTVEAQAALLAARSRPSIVHVPHGIASVAPADEETRVRARREVVAALHVPPWALEDAVDFALVLGMQGPGKNLEGTIRGLAEAAIRGLCGTTVLLVAGEFVVDGFLSYITGLVGAAGLGHRVFIRAGWVDDKLTSTLLESAHFGVLNSTSFENLSASGQVGQFARRGVPLAVADVPIYSDAMRGGALSFTVHRTCPADPTMSCVTALGALSASPALRAAVGAQLAERAVRSSWIHVGELHAKWYRHLLAGKEDVDALR